MENPKILLLLQEAAGLGVNRTPFGFTGMAQHSGLEFITKELTDAAGGNSPEAKKYAQGLVRLLLLETVNNRPELLPSLYPAFSLLCGPEGQIDWTLVVQDPPPA